VIVSSFRVASDFAHRCRRHYFLKHLADVVNDNAKRKHDINISDKGVQPNNHEHRSGKVAGVVKRSNSRLIRAATPSLDWTSSVSRYPYDHLYP
jgi:hypothetical protein